MVPRSLFSIYKTETLLWLYPPFYLTTHKEHRSYWQKIFTPSHRWFRNRGFIIHLFTCSTLHFRLHPAAHCLSWSREIVALPSRIIRSSSAQIVFIRSAPLDAVASRIFHRSAHPRGHENFIRLSDGFH